MMCAPSQLSKHASNQTETSLNGKVSKGFLQPTQQPNGMADYGKKKSNPSTSYGKQTLG